MRVIAGALKGRSLVRPLYKGTRPTPDRLREAVFSMIESRGALKNQHVLDAFAGSGALGIEALSRGADSCVFYESCREVFSVLSHNIHTLSLEGRALLIPKDILKHFKSYAQPFSLLFFDPPYGKNLIIPSLEILHEYHAMAEDALCVFEMGKEEEIQLPPYMVFDHCRIYGSIKMMLAYYQKP
jgi:16S rRNA (guanine966-N2)-methyltransferase